MLDNQSLLSGKYYDIRIKPDICLAYILKVIYEILITLLANNFCCKFDADGRVSPLAL